MSEQCGCKIEYSLLRHYPKILYCPLHAAAQKLLEACKKALDRAFFDDEDPVTGKGVEDLLEEAIALAEPTKE